MATSGTDHPAADGCPDVVGGTGAETGMTSTMKSVAIALGQALLIAASLYLLLGASHRDLRVPLKFSSDSLWFLMQSKSTVDNGWWWSNSRLGAPFALDELAYPSNSNVDQAIVWAVSRFVQHPI